MKREQFQTVYKYHLLCRYDFLFLMSFLFCFFKGLIWAEKNPGYWMIQGSQIRLVFSWTMIQTKAGTDLVKTGETFSWQSERRWNYEILEKIRARMDFVATCVSKLSLQVSTTSTAGPCISVCRSVNCGRQMLGADTYCDPSSSLTAGTWKDQELKTAQIGCCNATDTVSSSHKSSFLANVAALRGDLNCIAFKLALFWRKKECSKHIFYR